MESQKAFHPADCQCNQPAHSMPLKNSVMLDHVLGFLAFVGALALIVLIMAIFG